jgi:glycosyltransferase involved in cell wall biosynthesis
MSYNEPELWLKRINFFTVLVEEMAKTTEVKSIHCINHSGVLQKNGAEFHFLKISWLQFLFPFGIHRYVRKLNPEAVVVHGLPFPWHVLWLRQRLGKKIKIVVQHHAERPLRHYKRILQKLIDPFISAYIFTSLEQARPWVEQRQIKSLGKVFEIMEVPSVFGPLDKKEAIKKTDVKGGTIYLWVGRLDANKDPITLVTAFIRFTTVNQDAHLYVVFHGDELIGEVKEVLLGCPGAAGRITLVGKVEHDELLYWFNSADFIISTSHYEGSGIAVSEAMSCGCIPILTNIPSFRMMSGNGKCGITFPPGDTDGLLQALVKSEQLVVSVERDRVLNQYREYLSAEAISEKMITLFKRILKDND